MMVIAVEGNSGCGFVVVVIVEGGGGECRRCRGKEGSETKEERDNLVTSK